MQHRRGHHSKWRYPRAAMAGLLLLILLVVGIGALMAVDVPAPSRLIERELDAKALLH